VFSLLEALTLIEALGLLLAFWPPKAAIEALALLEALPYGVVSHALVVHH
jgi:hypothetical protein